MKTLILLASLLMPLVSFAQNNEPASSGASCLSNPAADHACIVVYNKNCETPNQNPVFEVSVNPFEDFFNCSAKQDFILWPGQETIINVREWMNPKLPHVQAQGCLYEAAFTGQRDNTKDDGIIPTGKLASSFVHCEKSPTSHNCHCTTSAR